MTWKNTLRKQELNMDIGSTNYAKDLGDSIEFGEGGNTFSVPKSQLVAIVKEFDPSITRLTQITMQSEMTDKFVIWLKKNMSPQRSQTPYSSTTAGSPEQTAFQQNY